MHYQICLLAISMIGFCDIYGSELPRFIQKYSDSIPHIAHDEPSNPSAQATVIVDYLCRFIPHSKKNTHIREKEALENKIATIITNKKPLSLLLLGFPFKSTNHEKKCLSEHIDLGEYLSIITLHTMVTNINSLYPDTHCTIISDGLAYHIDDYDPSYANILQYHDEIKNVIQEFPRPIIHLMENQQPPCFI